MAVQKKKGKIERKTISARASASNAHVDRSEERRCMFVLTIHNFINMRARRGACKLLGRHVKAVTTSINSAINCLLITAMLICLYERAAVLPRDHVHHVHQ